MGIYIIVFAMSVFFFYAGGRVKGKQIRAFFILLGILLPSLLAGCRASSIGVDSELYGISFYERALASENIADYVETQEKLGHTDAGFNAIVYFASCISEDYHFGFFIYQLIFIATMYLGVRKCHKRYHTPVWLGMLLVYLCLYNVSLNAMRQCVAVGVSFYAFTFILEKKYKSYVILMMVATLVHSSAVVGVVPLLMYIFLQKGTGTSEKKQVIRGIWFTLALFVAVSGVNEIVSFFVDMGFLRQNYLSYIEGGRYALETAERTVSVANLSVQLIYLVIFIMHYRVMNKKSMGSLFFTMMSLITLVSVCLGPLFASYTSRISFYFMPLQMVGLANTSLLYKKNSSHVMWAILLIVLVFVIWVWRYVYLGESDTVPYRFFWN